MPNVVTDTALQIWTQGRKTRRSPSGWVSGNAVCCDDKRGRGGIRITKEDGWVWHCFNCQTSAGWAPGSLIGPKAKRILEQMGANDQQLSQISIEALRLKEQIPLLQNKKQTVIVGFEPKQLPNKSEKIIDLVENNYQDNNFIQVCEYIISRQLPIEKYYWSNDPGMERRFIVPFWWKEKLVGWTARAIDKIKNPKYLSSVSSGYVYGLNEQDESNKIILACEGVLDADSIGACAILGNNINEQQEAHLKRTNKKIIFVPDQDETGLDLAQSIAEKNWSVSLPNWNCKDINEAVILYGRTVTLLSIMQQASSNKLEALLKIKQMRAKLKAKNERFG